MRGVWRYLGSWADPGEAMRIYFDRYQSSPSSPKTVDAVAAALAFRPEPKDRGHAARFFITDVQARLRDRDLSRVLSGFLAIRDAGGRAPGFGRR
jgi:hypothetical protein